MPPPEAPSCLIRPYSAKPGQKGGTMISSDVVTRAEHRRRLSDPDCYRPSECANCHHHRLHAHDIRERKCRNLGAAVEKFRRYKCVYCRAIWMVLTSFMPRYLQRVWLVVQSTVVQRGGLDATGAERHVDVAKSTVYRWLRRLRCSAAVVTQAFAEAAALPVELLADLRTRGVLVDSLTAAGFIEPDRKMEATAEWIHRISPGLRLI